MLFHDIMITISNDICKGDTAMLEKLYEGVKSFTQAIEADWIFFASLGTIIILFVAYFIVSVCSKNYNYRKKMDEISSILQNNDPLDRACMKQIDALFEKLPVSLYCTWNRMLLQKNSRAVENMAFERSFDLSHSIFQRVCKAVGYLLVALMLFFTLSSQLILNQGVLLDANFLLAPLFICVIAVLAHFFLDFVDKLHASALRESFYSMVSLIDGKITKSAILTLQEEPRTELAAAPTVAKSSEGKQPGTIDMILAKIDEVKASGADSQSVEQIILMLQQEKEKQSNNNPEAQRRINDALADLLRSISDEE